MPPVPKHTRRWFQFSLGTTLAAVTAVGVLAAGWTHYEFLGMVAPLFLLQVPVWVSLAVQRKRRSLSWFLPAILAIVALFVGVNLLVVWLPGWNL